MKKLICVFLSIVFCVTPLCPAVVSAQDGDVAEITDERFPDPGFRQWLAGSGFDRDGDGRFSQEELDAVWTIVMNTYRGPEIHSLEGIQFFRNLKTLDFSYSSAIAFTELNLSGNPALEALYCYDTNLAELDVSGNPALKKLYCYNTNLAELDVSGNPALETLSCYNTNIAELDTSGNPALYSLSCYNTNLTELDTSRNPALVYLYCEDTDLTTLDLSGNPALERLYCYNTNLTELDTSRNPALVYLECNDTNVAALNVSGNPALELLYCYNTNLTELDTSENPALKTLSCHHTNLTTLDVSGNPALESLSCNHTNLTTLHVSGNPALVSLDCYNTNLTALDVRHSPNLRILACSCTNLTELDVSGNPALANLTCSDTKITELDISRNPKLESLLCSDTNISSLDISRNPKLFYIDADNTNLFSLSTGQTDVRYFNMFTPVFHSSTVITTSNDTYDLLESDPALDPDKIDNLEGATLNGSVLSDYKTGTPITYDYNCGSYVTRNGDTYPLFLSVTITIKIKKVSVTFYTEDGTELDKAFVRNGQLVDADGNPTEPPTAPEKPATQQYSYTFDTWVDEEGKPVDLLAVTADTKVYASYTATLNKYTVTFLDEDKKTEVGTSTVDYGTAATAPASPTKAEDDYYTYAFDKWVNEDGTDADFGNVTEDMTVYASYTATFKNPFGDADLSRYYGPAVEYVTAHGIMNGTDATHFSPGGTATRGMIVTVLYRMEGSPSVEGMENKFTDVPEGKYYTDAVKWASNVGVVNGTGDNTFSPNNNVTREQFATMIYRYAGEIKGYYMSCGNATLGIFADKNEISSYAVNAVKWAIASEKDMTGQGITYYNKTALIEGIQVDENTVNMNPKGNATRGQMATMLYRFITGDHLDAADIE